MVFISSKKLFSFLRYSIFCRFFHFPSTVSRFKWSDQKSKFSKQVLQLKERLVTSSRLVFVCHNLVHKKRIGARLKIKLTFSWSLLKYVIHKCLLHALAVLDYLPKLKLGAGLDFSTNFLQICFIKMFLVKYPLKYPYPINCFLAIPKQNLAHSQRGSLTNPILITAFSTIFTRRSPGALERPNLVSKLLQCSD